MAILPINFNDNDRIAIIAPHPDDECIGAGGIMAMYPSSCDVFVVTDGRQGNKMISPEEEMRIRRKQFENEMKLAKVNSYSWLGYEDGALMRCQENFLSDIDFSVYSKIFIPWGDDNHADHTAVYDCAVKTLREQEVSAEVYQYEVHVPFHDVSHYVDITNVLDIKLKFILCHTDQVASIPYHNIADALSKYRACQGNQPQARWETFLSIDLQQVKLNNDGTEREKVLQKYQAFYRLLYRWLRRKICSSEGVADILKRHGWYKIVIYGFSDLGRLFYDELCRSEIQVVSIMDSRSNLVGPDKDHPVLLPSYLDVDVVVVTAITHYREIKCKLKILGYQNIISLQSLLEENT